MSAHSDESIMFATTLAFRTIQRHHSDEELQKIQDEFFEAAFALRSEDGGEDITPAEIEMTVMPLIREHFKSCSRCV